MRVIPFWDRERSVAGPGYSRWLVPPAALSIHLAIGQVYAFSVFKIPLAQAIGITHSTEHDWNFVELGWIFSIAIVFLGLSAAMFGHWLEDAGPRRAMFVSACCFASGFLVSALGVVTHQLWLIYLGYGVIGGIGLGLGYISPVSTLIKWFPDRPGMATGLAIMGFGGGAMIGAPLANTLMNHFKNAHSVGVAPTFVVMGICYFLFMMFGVLTVRVPPPGWKPAGWTPPAHEPALITTGNVDVNTAFTTPQFWLLWVILCANVTAGIGILEQASPMIQEIFRPRITAAAAGGFVGLLSLFNMIGRFFWASTSDRIGRKPTYMIFFTLGAALYVAITFTGPDGLNSIAMFVACCLMIISMYGGGFATIPAYIRDLFGVMHVSAIHGRVLTAWSVAGVAGPLLVNSLREHQLHHGVPVSDAYWFTLYIMAGLLVIGLIANMMVRPVDPKYFIERRRDTSPQMPPGFARPHPQ
ncbi:MAG: major facilitator superfamily protein [Phycisphaerales bacterium]|nr:major facilitator superfamily protein [Phycisphaerales bacterium]